MKQPDPPLYPRTLDPALRGWKYWCPLCGCTSVYVTRRTVPTVKVCSACWRLYRDAVRLENASDEDSETETVDLVFRVGKWTEGYTRSPEEDVKRILSEVYPPVSGKLAAPKSARLPELLTAVSRWVAFARWEGELHGSSLLLRLANGETKIEDYETKRPMK